jgi:Flp pilus assembly protein TadD
LPPQPPAAVYSPSFTSFLRIAARSRDPNTRRRAALILSARARWAIATGDPHLAVAEWQRAVELQSEDGRFLYNLGTSLHRIGELAAAERAWQRAIALPQGSVPTQNLARAALGRVQLERGHPAAAVATLRDVLAHGVDTFEVRYNLGGALLHLGRPKQALPHLRVAATLQPAEPRAWRRLAVAQEWVGCRGSALRAVERADSLTAAAASAASVTAIAPAADLAAPIHSDRSVPISTDPLSDNRP